MCDKQKKREVRQQNLQPQNLQPQMEVQGQEQMPQMRYEEMARIDYSRSSEDMIAVRDALSVLSRLTEETHALTSAEDVENLSQGLDEIENQYIEAIAACSTYVKHKDESYSYYSRKRYAAVKNTRDRLRQEMEALAALRKDLAAHPERYQEKTASFAELSGELQREQEEDPVNRLKLKDYVRIISRSDGKSVLCRNGKLLKRGDKEAGSQADAATPENYRMAKHFVDLLLKKQNVTSEKARERISRNLLNRLGADIEAQTSLPVSLSMLKEIIQDSDVRLTETDNALAEQKKDTPEYQIAEQINRLLGRSLSSSSNQKALRRQVEHIMEACRDNQRWKTAGLGKTDMKALLNGEIETVRDRVYEYALHICKARQRLTGKDQNEIPAMSDEEMKILMGIAISETVTGDSVQKAVYAQRLNDYAEDRILKEDEQLKAGLLATRIMEFGCFTASDIRLYYTQQPEKLAGIPVEEQRKGMEALCSILEHMQELMGLEARGVQQGLHAEEIQELVSHASAIDRTFSEHTDSIERLKNILNRDGGLRCGIEKLQELYRRGGTVTGSLAGNLEKLNAVRKQEEPEEELGAREIIAEYKAARRITETMPDKVQPVASFFLGDKHPSELFKRAGTNLSKDFIRLHDALEGLQEDSSVEVKVNGIRLTFIRKDDILTMQAGGKQVALPYTADYWTKEIEGDICAHFEKYDKEMAKAVLSRASGQDYKEKTGNRVNYERFLTSHLGISSKDLNLLDAMSIQRMVWSYFNVSYHKDVKDGPKNYVLGYMNRLLSNRTKQVNINSQTAIECLTAMQSMNQEERQLVQDKTSKKVELGGEDTAWPEEQQQILNLIGELYFSTKAASDKEFPYTKDRIQKVLLANLETFRNLAALMMDEEAEEEFAEKLSAIPYFEEAYQAVKTMVNGIIAARPLNLKASLEAGELDGVLTTAADSMAAAVANISARMQELLKSAVDDMEEETDDDWKELSDFKVSEILQNGMTGKGGEGSFNKKVLSGYIANAAEADKQNMVASAFRNAPNTMNPLMTSGQREAFQGRFLSGYLKGAGPLLHKMMQGLAISNMPTMMQAAVKDVRSNLARIDDEIVDAQLHRIIKDSAGSIDRIEKVKILGTASVGEAVLIKVYEKGAAQGVEKVVKILRPDAGNHMERELAFMKKCAAEVDKEAFNEAHKDSGEAAPEDYRGAMSRTFDGRVENIKKEFDLRLEAENIELGKVYEDPLLHIGTMKLDGRTKASANALVLERAPGVSVDRFLSDQDNKRKELFTKARGTSLYGGITELYKFKKELKEKEKFLTTLTGKWLDEALFGSGFFHGDLHAGNIMIDQNGVTVIDYGNVHKLSGSDQMHIVNLIAAMGGLNTKRFTNHLTAMLSDRSQEIYESRKQVIDRKIRTIVKKEDQADSIEKIMAVLLELQKDGIDIPAGLYNFIQSFVRMSGTLTDYSTLIDNVDKDMVKLMEERKPGEMEKNPDEMPMALISQNILSRYDKKHLDPKAKPLEESIRKAVDGKNADTESLVKLCRKKSGYYVKNLGNNPQMGRFAALLNSKDEFFIDRLMGRETYFGMNTAMCIIELKYDSRITGDKVREKMRTIHLQLEDRVIEDAEQRLTYIGNRLEHNETLINHTDQIRADLERDIAHWSVAKEGETERDKKDREIMQASYRNRLDQLPELVRIAEKEVVKDRKEQKIYQEILESIKNSLREMKEHIEAPGYTKEAALQDLENYQNCFRSRLSDGLELPKEQEELELLEAMADLTCCTYRRCDQPRKEEWEDSEKMLIEQSGLKDIELLPEDEQRRREEEENAVRRLEEAAMRVYLKTRPRSYKEQLALLLTDKEKVKTLGDTLKEWFSGKGGAELRTAYLALTAAYQEGRQVEENSPEVAAVTEAMVRCIGYRASELDDILKEKKKEAEDNNDESSRAMKELLWNHCGRLFLWLDGRGTFYLKEHRLDQEAKDRIKADGKARHTSFVEDTFKSLESCKLKDHIETLTKAARKYRDGVEKDKNEAVQTINEELSYILKALMSDIRFHAPGRKQMKALLEKYEEKPSGDKIYDILREADEYISGLFKDTAFMDPREENGVTRPSRYEAAYGNGMISGELFFVLRDLPAPAEMKKKDGKEDNRQPALIDRLRSGEVLHLVTR